MKKSKKGKHSKQKINLQDQSNTQKSSTNNLKNKKVTNYGAFNNSATSNSNTNSHLSPLKTEKSYSEILNKLVQKKNEENKILARTIGGTAYVASYFSTHLTLYNLLMVIILYFNPSYADRDVGNKVEIISGLISGLGLSPFFTAPSDFFATFSSSRSLIEEIKVFGHELLQFLHADKSANDIIDKMPLHDDEEAPTVRLETALTENELQEIINKFFSRSNLEETFNAYQEKLENGGDANEWLFKKIQTTLANIAPIKPEENATEATKKKAITKRFIIRFLSIVIAFLLATLTGVLMGMGLKKASVLYGSGAGAVFGEIASIFYGISAFFVNAVHTAFLDVEHRDPNKQSSWFGWKIIIFVITLFAHTADFCYDAAFIAADLFKNTGEKINDIRKAFEIIERNLTRSKDWWKDGVVWKIIGLATACAAAGAQVAFTEAKHYVGTLQVKNKWVYILSAFNASSSLIMGLIPFKNKAVRYTWLSAWLLTFIGDLNSSTPFDQDYWLQFLELLSQVKKYIASKSQSPVLESATKNKAEAKAETKIETETETETPEYGEDMELLFRTPTFS